jgi:DNA repair protein Swi5/Sae3
VLFFLSIYIVFRQRSRSILHSSSQVFTQVTQLLNMSMDRPPSKTPSRPIRQDGEVLDSQDDNEQHFSDFEDLLEEAHVTSNPAPEASAPDVVPEPKEQTQPPLKLPFPSTAAHTFLLTTPHLPSPDPAPQPQTSPARNDTESTESPSQCEPQLLPPPQATNSRTSHLQSQITDLQSKIASTQTQLTYTNTQLSDPSRADAVVKAHIKLLHSYNEIKDVGLGLMGLIADGRGVRLGEVMAEFGVGGKD